MKTLVFAVAAGVVAFVGLRLLTPSPSWPGIGESLTEALDEAARVIIGKGETKVGLVVPAVPTVPAYGGAFQVGQEVEVANAGGCMTVRTYPSLDAPTWACLPEGTRLEITVGPLYANGMWWWAVERQGWAAELYLAPVFGGEEEPLIAQGVAAQLQAP